MEGLLGAQRGERSRAFEPTMAVGAIAGSNVGRDVLRVDELELTSI